MTEKKQTKPVMSEEVALAEFQQFLNHWKKKPTPIDEIKEPYQDCIDALMSGNLIFNDEKVPTYKLLHPVKNSDGEISCTEVTFKTRVKPNTKANLADGLDLQKSAAKFSLRLVAHVANIATVAELDSFHRDDYDVISTIAPVFF